MNTLVGFFLILIGLYELFKLVNRGAIDLLLTKSEEIAKKIRSKDDIENLTEEETKSFLESILYILLMCCVEMIEVAVLLFSTVYHTGLFRGLIFSVFLLGFVSYYLKKLLPKSAYGVWKRLDYLYCATVLIGGTLYFT